VSASHRPIGHSACWVGDTHAAIIPDPRWMLQLVCLELQVPQRAGESSGNWKERQQQNCLLGPGGMWYLGFGADTQRRSVFLRALGQAIIDAQWVSPPRDSVASTDAEWLVAPQYCGYARCSDWLIFQWNWLRKLRTFKLKSLLRLQSRQRHRQIGCCVRVGAWCTACETSSSCSSVKK
jgi:hypothetical protein